MYIVRSIAISWISRSSTLVLLILFAWSISGAQTLNRAEYFFDSDPGIGNATPVSFTAGSTVDFSFNANVSSLSPGFHNLSFRIRSNTNTWSHFQTRAFYIVSTPDLTPATTITRGEYYFDNDPGKGNGVSFSVTSAASINSNLVVPITSLTPGFHNLNLRTVDNRGRWAHAPTRTFYIVPPLATNNSVNVTKAEYFFDSDPGTGNGINVPVTPSGSIAPSFVIPVNALTAGFHTLNFRVRDDKGRWSHFATRTFYILSTPVVSTTVVRAEYFFDQDPGTGLATPLAINAGATINQSYALDISSLTPGFHRLGIRYRDNLGKWSHFQFRTFYIVPGNALPAAEITDIEYFIDTDPGIGKGIPLQFTPSATVDQAVVIDLSGLPGGEHELYVRAKDSNGFWSTKRMSPFTLIACTPPTAPVSNSASRCGAGQMTLDAGGATASQVYRWYSDAAVTTPLFEGPSYTTDVLNASRKYYVSKYDAVTLCESPRTEVEATVVILPKPALNLTGALSICDGESVVLRGPQGFTSYTWSNGLTTPTITANTSATYTLSVGTGTCTSPASDPFVLTIDPGPSKPVIQLDGPSELCGPATATLIAPSGADRYEWSTGETTRQITVSSPGDYIVRVFNATGCGSPLSAPVKITAFPSPAKPIIQTIGSSVLCNSNTAVTLRAPFGFTVYQWSNGATTQEITLTTAGAYSVVTGNSPSCLSISSDPVEVTQIQGPCGVVVGPDPDNRPPVIDHASGDGPIDGVVTISLEGLISDPDNDVDYSSLRITGHPASGATASIDADNNLVVNYTNVNFAGTEDLTIQICDFSGSCTQQQISVRIAGDIVVYNGLSPNGDGKNDVFLIEYVDLIQDTQNNQVTIYNRWGNIVFEMANYNNSDRVFEGLDNEGNELPNGIYYFKIKFNSGKHEKLGYLTLRR